MECLWLKMEAVLASSPQTLPKKQKVSCFLVSYMPLACAPRATAAYARGGPRQPAVTTRADLCDSLASSRLSARRLDTPETALPRPLALFCRARCVDARNRSPRPVCTLRSRCDV